jgi:hypothetical protein
LLHLHGATHCPIGAVEHDEKGVASRVDEPAAKLVDGWIDQIGAERPEPFERSYVIEPDQTAITDHVGVDHGNQLPPPWRPSDQARCVDPGHHRRQPPRRPLTKP